MVGTIPVDPVTAAAAAAATAADAAADTMSPVAAAAPVTAPVIALTAPPVDTKADDDGGGRTVRTASAAFASASGDGAGARKKAKQFNDDMHQSAPTDIMFQGNWLACLQEAKRLNKWIIVNIQSEKTKFDCHRLNRDVWRDESTSEVIAASFVFWQQLDSTPCGQAFVKLYQVSVTPHVIIVDPRTEECQWKSTGESNTFRFKLLEKIQDLLSRSCVESTPSDSGRLPVSKSALLVSTKSSGGNNRRSAVQSEKHLVLDDEDEDFQKALYMSMHILKCPYLPS
jgi:hypothetical protein